MIASLNYKSTGPENVLKVIPNISNVTNANIKFYESITESQSQRPSLTLSSRPSDLMRKREFTYIEPMSNSRAYSRIYREDLASYFNSFLKLDAEPFLTGHQINHSLRARMLDWMV